MSKWSYNNNSKIGPKYWNKNFPSCNIDGQSPININTNETRICNLLCQLKFYYKPNVCKINNDNNFINILYDNGSYVIYKSENNTRYNLFKIIPHIPGLHKVNDLGYDMELHLYHKNKEGKVLIVAIFVNVDQNFSYSQDFFNQFVPNLRNITSINTDEDKIGDEYNQQYDYSINVSNDWNVENALPVLRNFFIYKGTLPYPPCTGDIIWVIFENTVNINKDDFNILKERLIYQNSRQIYSLNNNPNITRFVYYNNDIGVGIGSKAKGKIYIKCKKIETNKNTYTQSNSSTADSSSGTSNSDGTTTSTTSNSLEDFFNSSTWTSIKSLLSWILAIYLLMKFVIPNMNYSFEYNQVLYRVISGNQPDLSVNFENKEYNYEELLKLNDVEFKRKILHSMINNYLSKNKKIWFDFSNDTWFNKILWFPHVIFYAFWQGIILGGRKN